MGTNKEINEKQKEIEENMVFQIKYVLVHLYIQINAFIVQKYRRTQLIATFLSSFKLTGEKSI